MTTTSADSHAEVEFLPSPTGSDSGRLGLSDGKVVTYRPILPTDAPALRRFHDRLSGESIRLRFMALQPHLSEQQADYFTHLDGVDRFALAALDPARPSELIAVVRYDRDPGTDRAEYAAVVADVWQGRGLGLALTRRLIEAARARQVRSLYALVLPENCRMLNLLRDLGLPERIRFGEGVERIEIDLGE